MSEGLHIASFVLLAFLLGSVPFGLIIARAFGVNDLTKRGSGNIGATNVARVIGFWPAGVLTLVLDGVKGTVPLILLHFALFGSDGFNERLDVNWGVGLAACVGHCFSPWLKFRGGKGVATSFAILLFLAPWTGLVGAVGFAVAFSATRIGAVGSLTGALLALAVHTILYPAGSYLLYFGAMIAIIIYRHESNLDALLKHEENTF